MGSDVGQIFPTASLHRDHSISYALVCEKGLSQRSGCVRYWGYYMNAHLLGERGLVQPGGMFGIRVNLDWRL